MNELISVLKGCLESNTVRASQQRLRHLGDHPEFTEQLLRLIPNQENHLLIMVLSTLKNYITERYNSKENRISNIQKEILKNSLLDLYYQIKHNPNAVELYKQIVAIVVMVDYPWPGVEQQLMDDLNGRIEAGIYFARQVVKSNQYFENEERIPLQQFITHFFPKLEDVVEQILSNFNEDTSRVLEVILKTFYSSFHIAIPQYLRDFSRLERWMVFFTCLFGIPSNALTVRNQSMTARIYIRLFSLYCNDSQDGKDFKGWACQFRNRYAHKLYQHVYQLVASRMGNQETLSSLINCVHEVVKKEDLRGFVTSEQIENLIYRGVLLPLCESSREELTMFNNEEIEYVRRQDDLTCFPIRRATLDLIEIIVNTLTFNGKQELMRMVQYCASVLTNNASTDGQKQVAVRILSTIGKTILRHQYFKKQFQNLVVTYFQPLLSSPNKLLNSLICQLLAQYLPFGDLSPGAVSSLMQLIYDKIVNENSLVVRYHAILAFTALLGHKAALEAARPHFQAILEIYVKTLNNFDHESLLQCLETIVKHFDSQIVAFAPDLMNHLLRMFCSLAKVQQEDNEEDEPDGNNPASAALSTVRQILSCKLTPQVYLNVSNDLIDLLRGIFNQYNEFFDEVLSLFAVLCHKAKLIADFEYPYAACRRLLQGKAFDLQRSNLNGELLGQLHKIQQSDSEYEESLIAILKNIIQKAPDQVLRNYSWPTHPQLILALIENQRISAQELSCLNTSEVNQTWSPYLAAYSWIIYGVGGLSNLQTIKNVVGVSLFPWLKEGVSPQLVKLVVDSVENEEEDDDDLIEQNTAQLLEKYANEDDEEDEQQFYENSGDNYGFLYDSPFDSSKDREMLISQVKSLSQEAAVALVNSLSLKYRKKLQILMSAQ